MLPLKQLARASAAIVFLAFAADAHDLEITAAVAGSEIEGKVFYPSGESANFVDVEALDREGKVFSETKTDGQGRFTIAAPGSFPVTVAAETEDGHRDEITLHAAESGAAPLAEAEHDHSHSDAISANRVRTIVQEELRPLREQLAEQAGRTRARDIFGGIGYIVGVFGLIVLLKRTPGKRK